MSMVSIKGREGHSDTCVNPAMVAAVYDNYFIMNMGGSGKVVSRIPHGETSEKAVVDKLQQGNSNLGFIDVETTRGNHVCLNIDHIAMVQDGNITMNYGGARDEVPRVVTTEFQGDVEKKINYAEQHRGEPMNQAGLRGLFHHREVPQSFQEMADKASESAFGDYEKD